MAVVTVGDRGRAAASLFRRREVWVSEAVAVSLLWLSTNLVFDYPIFAYGPTKTTAGHYC
jgi:hypothetical protein